MLAILFFDEAEPVDGDVGHVRQVVLNIFQFGLNLRHQLVGLVFIKLQDALHLYLHEAKDIVACHLTNKVFLKGRKFLVDKGYGGIHIGSIFKAALFVDALFNEDALERCKEQLLKQFGTTYVQFFAQQAHGAVNAVAQHVAHREEAWFIVFNNTAVGREVYLAIREGVKGVDGLV